MKALNIMIFLLLLNLSISIVGGLHIYNIGVSVPEDFKQGDIATYEGTEARQSVVTKFVIFSIETLVAGMVGGTIISYLTRVPADRAYVYSLFFSSYWIMAWDSLTIMWGFGSQNEGIQIIVVVFSIIMAILFMVAIMQMPVGGWKSYV